MHHAIARAHRQLADVPSASRALTLLGAHRGVRPSDNIYGGASAAANRAIPRMPLPAEVSL